MTIDAPDEILRRIRSAESPHDMPVRRALVQWIGEQRVREQLAMRVGYAGTDFTQNILRFVGEERLTLCVTRPSAVCAITNLP